jgi:DNA repair protein RadC
MREGEIIVVRTARDAANLLAPLLAGRAEERVAVLHLGRERQLLHLGQGEVGGTTQVGLPIRSIVEEAIRHASDGILVAHNHPSGDPTPSAADINSTRRLATVTTELGIVLHDHLIFGRAEEISSFRLLGLL